MRLVWLSVFAFVWLVVPSVSLAQFNDLTSGVSLEVSPQYPQPGEVVTVRLNDYTLQGNATGITWLVDGVAEPTVANQRSVQLAASDIGQTTTVTAQLTTSAGGVVSANTTIAPSSVVLIVEPQTTAPNWYQGRALPSVGSQVRVVAIPQTRDELAPEAYTYTWRLNNEVISGGAVQGQYQNVLTMPFGRSANLDVIVSNRAGTVVAQRSVVIPNQEPEVYFYELNPLRGMGRLALGDTVPLVGSEMTMRAEVFHMSTGVSESNMLYEWKVNGRTTENPSRDPQTITVQNGGGTGSFSVAFAMRSLQNLLQGAERTFNLVF